MIPTRDSMHAMERHFFGALVAPARTWLETAAESQLAYAGRIVRTTAGNCMFDFGRVESPGEEHQSVRIFNAGPEDVFVRLVDHPAWLLSPHWTGTDDDVVLLPARAEGATLQLKISHDDDAELRGSIRFVINRDGRESVEEVAVRIIARHSWPIAYFDFNGSPIPRAFDFGNSEQPYALSIGNRSSVPLIVRFADLPPWLAFEVDGRRRSGPIPGRFFERAAPFTVHLRPQFLGHQHDVIRIETNDPRPELQTVELPLRSRLVAAKPCVRAFSPAREGVREGHSITVQARLENWGNTPAITRVGSAPMSLHVLDPPVVPPAHDAGPGRAVLPIRITPAQLTPGQHRLAVTLAITGGDPAEVEVPVLLDVSERIRRARIAPEMIAAVVTLLLLTLLFVFVVRGLP